MSSDSLETRANKKINSKRDEFLSGVTADVDFKPFADGLGLSDDEQIANLGFNLARDESKKRLSALQNTLSTKVTAGFDINNLQNFNLGETKSPTGLFTEEELSLIDNTVASFESRFAAIRNQISTPGRASTIFTEGRS